jgi:hypothetical protein
MPASQRAERGDDMSRVMRDALNDLIAEHVVHALGTPEDLFGVDVRPLGGDRYRVNVLVGKHVNSTRIADSYFLTADGDGVILSSSPEIIKRY